LYGGDPIGIIRVYLDNGKVKPLPFEVHTARIVNQYCNAKSGWMFSTPNLHVFGMASLVDNAVGSQAIDPE
jgi:hypothetical protein